MTRGTVLAATVAATAFLGGCGGGGESATETRRPPTPAAADRDTIYRTATVTDLVALGARKLTEAEFRSEMVGARLLNVGGADGAVQDGWTWKINQDGTAGSRGARGEWESSSAWWLEDGQYCRHGAGESAASASCSSVYELDGIYRFGSDGDPDNLAGWSVEVGGWDVGQLLYDGETFAARHVAAARQDNQEGRTEIIDPVGFSMRRTEEGDYVVTLDGFEHTFTRDQRTDVGAEGPNDASDIQFRAYGWTRRDFNENLDAGHSRGEHVMYFGAERDHEEIRGTDPELRTFVMFGNPTSDFSRVNDMTATYSGSEGGAWAWLHVYASSFEADNFDWERDRASLYSTDLEFTANFSSNTVSGRIDNFRHWENGDDSDEPYDMTLTMPETEFGTEGLSGTFVVSGQAVRQATADYDASFWGPDASDFAGTMTISGTDIDGADETPFVGIGHFQAKR